MSDSIGQFTFLPQAAPRPDLPLPTRDRWQPLRIGLVELFHYDSEEFWFHDGHLLLRGNNGTGKSKVLSLTLPFLFDAQLRASRIEPDGDPGKRMSWNLLVNSYDRRIGYSWIEFGRVDEEGQPLYLTLGAGLSAVAARPEVDSWYFIVNPSREAPRIGQDIWLVNDQRAVLTRERLIDALGGNGHVFEKADTYRRAVDERLFGIGARRYEALMDTLIQLRQPQLSRRPDEGALSDALTEALPPMPPALLADIADALNQLDEDRDQLEEFQALASAVGAFEKQYRTYAGILSRRQARSLRQAQTEFDNASRDHNTARDDLAARLDQEEAATSAHDAARIALAGHRTRLATLQSDPTMQDANRLSAAKRQVEERRKAAERADEAKVNAERRLAEEQRQTATSAEQSNAAQQAVQDHRTICAPLAETACVATGYGANPLTLLAPEVLADLPRDDFAQAQTDLESLVAMRRLDIARVRNLIAALGDAENTLTQRREALGLSLEQHGDALHRRDAADAAVDDQGRAHVEAWAATFAHLRHLHCDAAAPLAALAAWTTDPQGENPAVRALQAAQHDASLRFASRQHDLDTRASALTDEQDALEAERDRLAAGQDRPPLAPPTRAADTRRDRPGAPLWQVIEFREHVPATARAGLEAALEAAGLLDAWITPDGALIGPDGDGPWLDSQIVTRPVVPGGSLAEWMVPDATPESSLAPATVERLLAAIACGEADPPMVEAWVSADGRFRLGSLAGAWSKPQAVHIGYAARTTARARRLEEIATGLADCANALGKLDTERTALDQDRHEAEQEWLKAPTDDALRQAHLAAATAAREYQQAEDSVRRAQNACQEAEATLLSARNALDWDAGDLGLPSTPQALQAVEAALNDFSVAISRLMHAAVEWRHAWPDLQRQREREAQSRRILDDAVESLGTARIALEESQAEFDVLRDAVGVQVEELRQRLSDAQSAVGEAEKAHEKAAAELRKAGEDRAVAAKTAEQREANLARAAEVRTQAVDHLQRFTASTLLASALPDLELPDMRVPWTIEPALTLARRIEQRLADINDDEAVWKRIQAALAMDLQDLQASLSALGHHAPAEPSDWGLVVHVVYQNRPERPDALTLRLAGEIAQRSELLTAREREVLENHLQAEIANEVQRLLQAAEQQVLDINTELHRRPTSTGVRYRLLWQPLGENEGAPVGLAAARQKLLNTSPDLWTEEDRRLVGVMLQQRITAERERADAGVTGGDGGALVDLLARALDYRRWHRFRVQRYQDGVWRKLSGPASSGERALGLTVPLFAAIASFYSRGASPHAPRLILLDEAFAGIDDTARAHCMALIREFDLDFVITSEREWGCYAALPGVAICQLQRREGIDAVHISRWTWDGRTRRGEADPDRRFLPS